MIKILRFVVSILFILGGVGSIILGIYPITGSILTILGVIGAIFSYLSSESQNQQRDFLIDAQATLFAQHGLGNIYIELFKKELLKTGSVNNGMRILKKALDINPNDVDALAYLTTSLSLQLSFLQWLGRKISSREFNKSFIFTKTLAQKGRLLDPNNHVFLDVLGILFDIEGKHEKAREQFEKSGRLRSDPYWRLLMATSWHMSGEHDKSLHELQLSENEGAKGWFFDFYYGRALNSVGNSTRAINYLKSAYDKCGNRPELLRELSLSYHYNGGFFLSAKYAFLLAMNTMFTSLRFMMQNLFTAIIRVALGLTCPISKVCWKIIKHIPLVRYLQLKYFPPDEPEFTLGLILIKKGNYEAAEHNFRTSCNIIPNKAGSHINLGLCLALQGREDEALTEYDKAIKLNPHDKMFKSARDQIASGNMKRIVDQYGNILRNI